MEGINQSDASAQEKEKQHAELAAQKETLEKNLAEATLRCDKTDKQLLQELNTLSTHIGQCVEITAGNWQAFLTYNTERLYSMMLDRTESVSEQMRLLGERINQYQHDLYAYLDMLYEYLMLIASNTTPMPEKFKHFNAECLNRPIEDIHADYLYHWLVSATDETDALVKLGRMLDLVKARPQFLFEIDLFSKLPESNLKRLVTHFQASFFEPILTSVCQAGEITVDDDELRCLAILQTTATASANHCQFLPGLSDRRREAGLRMVTANMARLLLVSPKLNPITLLDGQLLLRYAVMEHNVELAALLVAKGASPALPGSANTSQHVFNIALNSNNQSIDMIKALLPTVTSYDENIVSLACHPRLSSICGLLFERLISTGQERLALAEIFFKHASLHANTSVMRFALRNGAIRSINLLDDNTSPLVRFATAIDCDDRAMALEALIHAGADIEFIHPNTQFNVLSQILSTMWTRCITWKYFGYSAKERRQRIESSITAYSVVLEILLRDRLPAAIIESDVTNNTLQWFLQNLPNHAFEVAFKHLDQKHKEITFANLLHIIDLLSVEQQKLLMSRYYHEGFKTALIKFLPPACDKILQELGVPGSYVS